MLLVLLHDAHKCKLFLWNHKMYVNLDGWSFEFEGHGKRKSLCPGNNYQSPAAHLQPLGNLEKWLKALKGSLGFPSPALTLSTLTWQSFCKSAWVCLRLWRQILMETLACAWCWKVSLMELSFTQQTVSSVNIMLSKISPKQSTKTLDIWH